MSSQEENSSQIAPGSSRTELSDFPSSTQLNTVPPVQTIPRPSRRYGATMSIARPQAAPSMVSFARPAEEEEDDRLKELYEKTRKQGFGPPSLVKKGRTVGRGGDVEMEDTQISSVASMTDRERYKAPSEILHIDEQPEEEEEQDLFAQTTRRSKRAASAAGVSTTQGTESHVRSRDIGRTDSQGLMPPPAQRRRIQSPSPSPEPGPSEDLAPRRIVPSQNHFDFQDAIPQPITRDEEFLRVVAERKKSKTAIDDLDKSFDSMLRIPKGQAQSEADKPDYSVLDEVPPPKAGNYIAVMRTSSLFRKDLGQAKEAENIDDGKPNFKKFKKVNPPYVFYMYELMSRNRKTFLAEHL